MGVYFMISSRQCCHKLNNKTCDPTQTTYVKRFVAIEKTIITRNSSKLSGDTKDKSHLDHHSEKKNRMSDLMISNKRRKASPRSNPNSNHVMDTITDPRHLRFQTWWRTKRSPRKPVPEVPFNIQQCIVEAKSDHDKIRNESVRLRSRRGPILKLKCPICCRLFCKDRMVRK
jgi:hypothetical protein